MDQLSGLIQQVLSHYDHENERSYILYNILHTYISTCMNTHTNIIYIILHTRGRVKVSMGMLTPDVLVV